MCHHSELPINYSHLFYESTIFIENFSMSPLHSVFSNQKWSWINVLCALQDRGNIKAGQFSTHLNFSVLLAEVIKLTNRDEWPNEIHCMRLIPETEMRIFVNDRILYLNEENTHKAENENNNIEMQTLFSLILFHLFITSPLEDFRSKTEFSTTDLKSQIFG